MTSRPHDALCKAAFTSPEHAAALLRSILPPAIRDAIRWDTLAQVPGSFIDEDLDDNHTDLLFSAKLVGTDLDAYIYLLFEHRSTPEHNLPRRMLGYLGLVWDEHGKQHGGPLPIVIPILISHVPGGWTGPVSMQELFEPTPDSIPGLAKYVPHITMVVEDLAHLSNDELKQRALATFPKLALWLLRDARDADTLFANLAFWVETFREALRAPNGMDAVKQLLSYISWVCSDMHFHEFREKIRQQLPETEAATMTIAEELIQQGRTEGRIEVLSQLILQKFERLPPGYRDRLASATEEQLANYCRRLLEVDSLEAVFLD